MTCPQCGATNPEVARFCYRCGRGLVGPDAAVRIRRDSYAISPGEGVHQLALISTILPHTNRRTADHYRWALLIGIAGILLLTFTGLLAAAVVAAAFLVPTTYLIYIYDTDLWQDSPLPVVLALFLLTGILAALVSLAFFYWLFRDQMQSLLHAPSVPGGVSSLPIGALLIFSVLLPVVAEVVKQIGPLFLATRPAFDDMIDGFTFGVASGTAYAAFETVVVFAGLFTAFRVNSTDNLGTWLLLILNLMLVKSLIYGSATGIAVAAFSGRGEGYDGFKPSYFANLALAIVANVAYWVGFRLLSFAHFGVALGVLWGVLIAALLLLRARRMLQTALVEAAVEAAASDRRPKAATTDSGYCPECEMQLLPDSLFCIVCGASVRATSTKARRHVREAVEVAR